MQTIVGVRFKKAGKIYYFDPNSVDIEKGDDAIVETARGMEYGNVVIGPRDVDDKEVVAPLKEVIRKATHEDYLHAEENKRLQEKALIICTDMVNEHNLPMRLVDVEYTFDLSKIVFYFTADGRVDFRNLVKDLASHFHTRIELRQIGVRDEAKMIGGLGICGREMCCRTFLGDFSPVSIRMAKTQNLSLNPVKTSGLCGRLMCCLKFEQDFYEEMYRKVPRKGERVDTPDGSGIVLNSNILKEIVKIKFIIGNDDIEIREYPLSEVKRKKH